jgi:nucleoside-diphosphate-sugar epimerase
LSVENARTQLGWEPRYASLREGITQFIEHYRGFRESHTE